MCAYLLVRQPFPISHKIIVIQYGVLIKIWAKCSTVVCYLKYCCENRNNRGGMIYALIFYILGIYIKESKQALMIGMYQEIQHYVKDFNAKTESNYHIQNVSYNSNPQYYGSNRLAPQTMMLAKVGGENSTACCSVVHRRFWLLPKSNHYPRRWFCLRRPPPYRSSKKQA